MPIYGFGFDGSTRPRSAEIAERGGPPSRLRSSSSAPTAACSRANFPVDKQSFSYDAVWNAFKLLTAGYSPDERALLFSGTARRIYRLQH